MELPPRTRRIPEDEAEEGEEEGTTSAHAENTQWGRILPEHQGNYLRARGEYPYRGGTFFLSLELPPRTRRIHGRAGAILGAKGTTSAHAENTSRFWIQPAFSGNYLRARGEYSAIFARNSSAWELPPRTRRIPKDRAAAFLATGTTSAHAENTIGAKLAVSCDWNYLRARGEYEPFF